MIVNNPFTLALQGAIREDSPEQEEIYNQWRLWNKQYLNSDSPFGYWL